MADGDPRTIDLDPRSAVSLGIVVLLLGLLVYLVESVPRTMTNLVLATLIALALEPVVELVQAHFHLRRTHAVAVVLAAFLILLGAFAVIVAPRAERQFANLDEQAPEVVRDLGQLPLIGPTLEENDVPEQIEEWIRELPDRLAVDTKPLENIGRAVADGVLAFFLTVLLAITLLLDGERLRQRVRDILPDDKEAAVQRFGGIAYRVVGRYVAGSLLVAVCAGLAILVFGLVLGIPLAPLAALWVCMTNLIPQIGGALGAVPFVLLGFSVSPTTGLLAAACFMSYQLFENHVLGPLISGRAVRLSPPIVMATVLIGVSAAGVVGALIAVPLVGAIKALYVELRAPGASGGADPPPDGVGGLGAGPPPAPTD